MANAHVAGSIGALAPYNPFGVWGSDPQAGRAKTLVSLSLSFLQSFANLEDIDE